MPKNKKLIDKLDDLKELNKDIKKAEKEGEEEIAREFRQIRRKKIEDINRSIDEMN